MDLKSLIGEMNREVLLGIEPGGGTVEDTTIEDEEQS